MRLLFSRFFTFLASTIIFLALLGWFAFATNFIGNFNRGLPPEPTGLRPVASLNELVAQLPVNSTFTILSSSPGVNIIVESPGATYFVVSGARSSNEAFSQQLTKARALPATPAQIGSFKAINHEVDLYRNQHNLQAYLEPDWYTMIIIGWSVISLILLLVLLTFLIAGLDKLRIKLSPFDLRTGATALASKKRKIITTSSGGFWLLIGSLSLGFTFALAPIIFSQPANNLPANYFPQKDMNALIVQLPGPAAVAILPGPTDTQQHGYHVLALAANGAVYYTQSGDPNAQVALLDEDGNVVASGADLATLQAADSKISLYINTANQIETQGFVAGLQGLFFGVWFALFLWTFLLGFLLSYHEQASWWSPSGSTT